MNFLPEGAKEKLEAELESAKEEFGASVGKMSAQQQQQVRVDEIFGWSWGFC